MGESVWCLFFLAEPLASRKIRKRLLCFFVHRSVITRNVPQKIDEPECVPEFFFEEGI